MSGPDALIEVGLIRPVKRSDPPLERIKAMAYELPVIIHQHCVQSVVVEVNTEKVDRRISDKTFDLSGMAAGIIWWECQRITQGRCHWVEENVWTRGVSKRKRRSAVAARFPKYADSMDLDFAADVADAIGLLLWWFKERSVTGS